MNLSILLQALSIILALFVGVLVYKSHRNIAGWFFLLFTISTTSWFTSYALFFSGIESTYWLLIFSRYCFGAGMISIYSIIFFIYYFRVKNSEISAVHIYWIHIFFLTILWVSIFTGYFVALLSYDSTAWVYREVYGDGSLIYNALYGVWLGLFIYIARRKLREQTLLNRIRLQHILASVFLLLGIIIILQLVLPAFNIWILEREIILLLPIFTIYINYTLKRWQFISHRYGSGQILICTLSLAIAMGVIWVLRSVYHSTEINEVTNYWNFADTYKIYDPLIGIVVFIISYNLLQNLLLGHGSTLHLKRQLRTLQSEISATKNLSELNAIVQAGIDRIFKAKYSEIILTSTSKEDSELSKFFIKNRKEKIFLKDLIFMEEKKRYFNTKKLLAQLPPDAYLALPLFNFLPESAGIGFCILGVKPFGDAYTSDEIEALQEFAFALELHLRYIDTYAQLRELSIHLDQKVDEKTFEYNQLINRQKEFIHLISHEIKSPIANAIFQIDSILDDVADKSATIPSINHDLELLNTSLIGVGELTNKLFSVEYFDIHSVSLFREKVQIGYMFQTEFEISSRLNPSIEFINQIDTSIGFVAVDRIQLQQVITNLLGNAIKFVKWGTKPAIAVQSYRDTTLLHLIIEDNGPGFSESNPETFFEKYAVGQSDSVGLGMGLYLCKKIIEMHGGTIAASNSNRMWGAKIHIQIPLQ